MTNATNSRSERPIGDLLLELRSRDVRLWLEGERLRVSAPHDALSQAMRDGLAERKQEIIRFLREAGGAGEAPIARRAHAGPDLPLSFDQERIWFLHQLNPAGRAFNLQTRLFARATPRDAQRAWNAVLERHEILRTTYRATADGPVQQVAPAHPVSLPVVDLAGLDDTAAREQMISQARAALGEPFDLEKGPAWRVLLFGLPAGRVGIFAFIHHIATDGWSLDRLNRELRELCEAFGSGRAPVLPPVPIQYADFAAWQRDRLRGDALDNELAYWRERLRGMPAVLNLPTDRPRPAVQAGNGAALTALLPARTSEALRVVAQRHRATPFMVLLAIFKAFLARNAGQCDVVVGMPIAGRSRPELEHVQGLFVNSLVLRTDLAGDPTFAELVARVRETVLGAFGHQSLPFEKLVDALRPQRDLARNPLFQVMFNSLIGQPDDEGALGERAGETGIRHAEALEGSVQVDLALDVFEANGALALSFSFDTDLFDASTVERWAAQYLRLAEAVAADDTVRIGAIDLLGEREREVLLVDWNATHEALGAEPVSRLFERHARETPNAPALEFEGEALTYAGLDARANRLARHLRSLGVGPEVKVAVYLERGIDMVVAVLAAMKAGGAYVPIDPAYPQERIAFMLEDSGAAVLLSQSSLLRESPGLTTARIVSVDGDAAGIARFDGDDLESAPAPHDLVHMIYTSGSTGRPKGVLLEHGALANVVQAAARMVRMRSDDVGVAVATLAFDIAGAELFMPLVSGARLVVASRATAADGKALAALLESRRVTFMLATPATWRLLIAAGWAGTPALRLISTGEALPRELAEQLLPRCGELWDFYGPTETAIWSTAHRITSGPGPVPIGRPIANTQTYILDAGGMPAPIGVAGELCIGGVGVARGYWQRDELTAQRFVANPFAPGRIYRTGDLTRHRADGVIEYLGRIDTQVKLRGFRIELGEIETVLERVAGVAAAVASVREDRPGDQRLVAYIVRASGSDVGVEALREAAARRLPAYMVPTAWMFPQALPLTPNGKVDRKALPAPEADARDGRHFVAPATATERALAQVWSEVLGVERVGVHDNFFDLGGHSLLAMQSLVRFKERTGIALPPRDFYLQTLGQLAASVAGQGEARHRPAGASAFELEPFHFGSGARRLFGLLRRPRDARGMGIVFCPPHAHEYVRSHRALRELAQRLAQSGFPILTFDYFGTGDSFGEYEEGRLAGWEQDAAAAVDALKERARVESACIAGLRLGATLAMSVAGARDDVQAVALWDPIVQGCDVEAELAEIRSLQALDPARQHDVYFSDVLAYPLTDALSADIAGVDLCRRVPRGVRRMLVLETGAENGGRRLVDLARAQGANADYRRLDEARVWAREPYQAIVPREGMAALLAWVEEASR